MPGRPACGRGRGWAAPAPSASAARGRDRPGESLRLAPSRRRPAAEAGPERLKGARGRGGHGGSAGAMAAFLQLRGDAKMPVVGLGTWQVMPAWAAPGPAPRRAARLGSGTGGAGGASLAATGPPREQLCGRRVSAPLPRPPPAVRPWQVAGGLPRLLFIPRRRRAASFRLPGPVQRSARPASCPRDQLQSLMPPESLGAGSACKDVGEKEGRKGRPLVQPPL